MITKAERILRWEERRLSLPVEKFCGGCSRTLPIDSFRVEHPRRPYAGIKCNTCKYKDKSDMHESTPHKFIRRAFSQLKSARARDTVGHRSYKWDLKVEQLLDLYDAQEGKCAITGMPMTHKRINASQGVDGNHSIISIDRIDNDGHYEINNMQLVCKRVNLMKGPLDQDVFIDWCRAVAETSN